MALKVFELISIVCAALISGMYLGPWLAFTRSLATFEPGAFLRIVSTLNRNMEPIMTFLTPVSLLTIIPVLYLSFGTRTGTFYLNLSGFALFASALLVTVLVELPIVKQIITWTESTMPDNWAALRDRWGAFHIVRVGAGLAGLILLVAGAIF